MKLDKTSAVAAHRGHDRTPSLDSPDEFQQIDEFGFDDFVDLISNQLVVRVNAPKNSFRATGLVVGITGPWGSGKSFILNWVYSEIRHRLEDNGILIRFEPWRVSGRGDILLTFLRRFYQEVNQASGATGAKLQDALPGRLRSFFSRHLDKGKEIVQSLLDVYEKGSGKVLQILLSQSVDQVYADLGEKLKQLDIPIVIVIDDLDRLDDSEIRDIAQLVKAVGQFENVSYLLAYDPARVARALTASDNVDEGLQYLEKIVQLQLRLPRVPKKKLRDFTCKLLELPQTGKWHDLPVGRIRQIIRDLVPEILWSPRDLVRFSNQVRVRMVRKNDLDLADLLRFAALEVRFPLLSERLSSLVARCTIDGARELQRCQEMVFPNGEEVIDYLLHGETQQSADRRFAGSRALLQKLFPALRADGTEQIARPVERLCYETSLKVALNHQIPEGLLSKKAANEALDNPQSLLAKRIDEAAKIDLLRHAHLRLRTEYHLNGNRSDNRAIWQVLSKVFDTGYESTIENWSMFLDLSHVWVRGVMSGFISGTELLSARAIEEMVTNKCVHFPACFLFFECSIHELYNLEQRASLRPILSSEQVREVMDFAAECFAGRILGHSAGTLTLKSLFPLWVIRQSSKIDSQMLFEHLSNPGTKKSTDDIVCLLFRTWHERIGEFNLKENINSRQLLQCMRKRLIEEEKMPLPVWNAYRFIQDNIPTF